MSWRRIATEQWSRVPTRRLGMGLAPFVLALLTSALLVLLVTQSFSDTVETFRLLFEGSWGSSDKRAQTLMVWVPLVLASAGLTVTFAAGLWNIGVEGQIIMGAIFASFIAREVSAPSPVLWVLTILAGLVGGLLWALLVGWLRTWGGVNEIFGGLGLFFVATSLTIYLIIGPWARTGIASTSGTDPFPTEAWLPRIGDLLSPLAIGLGVVSVVLVYFLLRGTLFGLRLKAVGANMESARLFGIPTSTYMLGAFMIGGALAGIAGTVQATGFHHKLVPSVSGAYGFLGILVVLLAGFRAVWIAPIALFFASIAVGSTQLQLRLDLDSALGGVIQGTVVLFAIFAAGWRVTRDRRAAARAGPG